MKHYLINLTWRCQNKCSYCWMQNTVGRRPDLLGAPERSFDEWSEAVVRDTPVLIDIAGGEPLLIPWLPAFILKHSEVKFGLSTNGLAWRALRKLLTIFPENLVSCAISYHPEANKRLPDYDERWMGSLRWVAGRGLRPITNIVNYRSNVEQSQHILTQLKELGIHCSISPYEETDGLGTKRSVGLSCQGGVDHLVIAPDGTAWPCLTALRSPYWRELSLGNWIDGTIDLSRRVQPCYLDCVDYYVLPEQHEAGDMWGVKARPATRGQR